MRRALGALAALVLWSAPATARADDSPRPLAFADLTLDDAETAALATSPDVQDARAVVRENAAALSAARGALGPALVANYVEGPQGGSNAATIAQRLTTVGLQTTLGDLVAYAPLVGSAAASLSSAQAALAAAERSERIKVIGLYFGALKARAISAAREDALRAAHQQQLAATVRVQAGDAPRLDVLRADVAVARADAAAATAQADDQNAAEALRTETVPSATLAATVGRPLPPTGPAIEPGAAAAQARANRADIRAAAAATLAARGAAVAARAQTLPAITVTGGFTSGVDAGVDVHGPSLSISLNLPLSGVASAQAQQREALAAQALARQHAVERQVALDAAASARNLAAAERASAATARARDEARSELLATELGYRNGASSSLEVDAARDAYTQALVDDLASLYDELKARATLRLETGA